MNIGTTIIKNPNNMKKTFLTLLLALCFTAGFSQMNNAGGTIVVESGATLVIEGSYTSTSSGTIEIDGTVQLKGNFINNSGSIATHSNGRLKFNGTGAQEITGSQSTTFYCAVELDNTSGVALTSTQTGAAQVLDSALIFTNGKVTLGNFDLTINANGSVSGHNSSKYCITDGTGRLIRTVPVSGSAVFPVGYSSSSYAPVTLANADVQGKFAVYVKDNLLDNCGTGSPVTNDVVTERWNIDNSLGSATVADITLGWAAAEEGTGFGNTDCSVIHCNAGVYDGVGGYGNGSGYSITGTNITSFNWFGIGDGAFGSVLVNVKTWLQGAYNGTDMNTLLAVPTSQPYSGSGFNGTHLDYDGTESVGTVPANTVDWVLVELRTGTAVGTKVGEVAAFIKNDGSIVYYNDGTSTVPIKGLVPGNYYVAIHHRNHLSIMTASTLSLTRSAPSQYSFTTGLTQAYDDVLIANDQMALLATGIYGMWAGDANFNKLVSYTAGSNDKNSILNEVGTSNPTNQVTAYSTNDVNCNGIVSYTAGNNDKNTVLNVVGTSNPTNVIYTHVPL